MIFCRNAIVTVSAFGAVIHIKSGVSAKFESWRRRLEYDLRLKRVLAMKSDPQGFTEIHSLVILDHNTYEPLHTWEFAANEHGQRLGYPFYHLRFLV